MNTKMKPLVLAILVATSVSLISCSKGKTPNDYNYPEESSIAESKEAEDSGATPPLANMVMEESEGTVIKDEKSASHKLESKAVNQQVANKNFVVNARAEFTVTDVVESVNKIEELTKENQGFIEASRIDNNLISNEDIVRSDTIIRLSRYVRTAEMTVRIPKENVSKFLKQLQKQVKFLQASEFSAKDVTLDMYRQQLESSISAEKVTELEKERLNAKKAKEQNSNVETIDKTSEAKTQKALAELEEKAIKDKIKYSTIKLSFSQPESIYQKTLTNTQQLVNSYEPSFQVQLLESLQAGWLAFKEVILQLVKGWWVILLIVLAISTWHIFRFFWQRTAQVVDTKTTKKTANANKLKKKAENKPTVQAKPTTEKKAIDKAIEPVKTVVEPPKTKTRAMPPPLPKETEKQPSKNTDKKD